ncbi:MAG: adenylosuccinate synthetase, partial [Aggregatilineales bacterium]
MPVTVVIGAQWGDEGKGRFVDLLSGEAQVVARYAGGDNAGHTVNVGETVYKLHLLPSGILRENTVGLMGNGMVINPVSLWNEITRLREMGVRIEPDNLIISSRAHVITPAHIEQDRAREQARGKDAIGTTLKGIGPAYLDKVGRRGIRTEQWLDVEQFGTSMQAGIARANTELRETGLPEVDPETAILPWLDAAEKLKPFLKDTTIYLYEQLQAGARIVCEGAQGALLDIDHGSYPFVTGSSPTVGGALTGLGIGPTSIDRVLGIAKAFNTRVGAGPMPTE